MKENVGQIGPLEFFNSLRTNLVAWLQWRCDMAFIEPMHRNKPNIIYLLDSSDSDGLCGLYGPRCPLFEKGR